mmetsp:Transcript_41178/g.106430  ORF Transcript_41178/g.106430 Transcript_41178/m.106430 type:complete len:211 (+) Transcript_41178:3158-3790(+)
MVVVAHVASLNLLVHAVEGSHPILALSSLHCCSAVLGAQEGLHNAEALGSELRADQHAELLGGLGLRPQKVEAALLRGWWKPLASILLRHRNNSAFERLDDILLLPLEPVHAPAALTLDLDLLQPEARAVAGGTDGDALGQDAFHAENLDQPTIQGLGPSLLPGGRHGRCARKGYLAGKAARPPRSIRQAGRQRGGGGAKGEGCEGAKRT